MTDENKAGTPSEGQQQPADNGEQKPNSIPYDRFSQVINERNEARVKLEALEKAAKEREEATLVEQKKYEELYAKTKTEYEGLAKQMEAVNSRVAAELEKEMAELTDDEKKEVREFLPSGITKYEELQKLKLLKSKIYNKAAAALPNDSSRPLAQKTQFNVEDAIKEMGDITTSPKRKAELMELYAKHGGGR